MKDLKKPAKPADALWTSRGGVGAGDTPGTSGALHCFPVWVVAVSLTLLAAVPSVCGFTLLSSNQLVFVNVDHAPMGACSTFAYGYKGQTCGIGMSSGVYPYWNGGGGVLIALSNSSGLHLLPFVASASGISTKAGFFPDATIQRSLTPCTDEYVVQGSGLAFIHYSPAWSMAELGTASLSEKKRYFLPATWMVFTIQNTNSTPEDFYFGLPVGVTQKTFSSGAYEGFALGEAALVVQSGSCDLLSGSRLASVFNGMSQGFVFHLGVPAGETRQLTVVVAYYRNIVVDSRTSSSYYYTSLYPSIDAVIDAAFAGFGDAQMRCGQLGNVMKAAGLNPYRQFLASYALHSYMADTACLLDPQGRAHWWEMEGFFNYINTFDLTVDHAFYDSYMHPWALRNVLDAFSGALPGTGYSFDMPLYGPNAGAEVSSHGFSFYHDMGLWPNSGAGPAYGAGMGDEELQAWILSAGLYWSHTADDAWLTNNAAILQSCLNSMLSRDNTNAAARDGITKNVNASEITTYDNLDASLQRPSFSGRLAVRNWACYLALNSMFAQIGDGTDAATCESMAAVTAQTIVNRWNSYRGTLGYIPALLDGSNTAATTPMIEGLAYPAAMGLTNALDRSSGPYASMLQALSNHVMAVLVPGRCLGASSGAWLMTSANYITWESKNFICQYAAEVVLGITNNYVNGAVDQIHASLEIQLAPFEGWTDALDGTGLTAWAGGVHYPRAITSALWWLNGTNNPSYPTATSPPEAPAMFTALARDHQVLLLWQGVPFATAYNLKRGTLSGGPYVAITNGVVGASLADSAVSNGTTYYYILTATNQIGESTDSPEVIATPVPAVASTISASVSASKITVSWPAAYAGWVLQTNTVGLGNPAAWGDVPGSFSYSQMSFPANGPGNPTEFFRLRHP